MPQLIKILLQICSIYVQNLIAKSDSQSQIQLRPIQLTINYINSIYIFLLQNFCCNCDLLIDLQFGEKKTQKTISTLQKKSYIENRRNARDDKFA